MTRPGMRLRTLAQRLCSRTAMERLIDPAIADLQFEYVEAVRHGRLWRARWIRLASCIAFCKVAALAAFASHRHGARAIAVGLSMATLLSALAIGVVLANTPATIDTQGKIGWLVLYLAPQALAISVPVCIALGLFVWIRGKGADPSTKRTVFRLMRLALLVAVVNTGWITPAANIAYRNVVGRGVTFRGANELTFVELGRRVYQGSPRTALDGPLPMTFWLNARLALTIAPVLLCVLALAGATTLHRRSGAAVVLTTLAVFVGCYLLFPADQIAELTRWLPAAAIAWIPDAAAAVATIILARRMPDLDEQRLRQQP